jgi:hypothetical protein
MHFTQILGINGNDKIFYFKNMLPWIYQSNYGVKKKYNSQDQPGLYQQAIHGTIQDRPGLRKPSRTSFLLEVARTPPPPTPTLLATIGKTFTCHT